MVTRNIFGISNKALTPLPSLFGKKNYLHTRKLILYDMGKFSLCQQTNVQEGFKKRHNKLALLAEPRQTPPPLNLGPVIGSYHSFEEIPKQLRSYLDNKHISPLHEINL